MHNKFIHRRQDALSGRELRFVHRHPTIELQAGLYEALKPVARKLGYKSVNQMIAVRGQALVMQLLLEDC